MGFARGTYGQILAVCIIKRFLIDLKELGSLMMQKLEKPKGAKMLPW